MKIAETVTFGGSGLDRAAHLRGDAAGLASAMQTGRVLALWHGKPLVLGGDQLGWLSPDSAVLQDAGPPLFLGLDNGRAVFACDISAWVPPAGTPTPAAGFLDATLQRHPCLTDDYAFAELRGIMASLSPREAELVATAKALAQWHKTHGFCAACGASSEIAMAGWQRTCPACGAHHFPRTDPVVIMLVTHRNNLLIGRSPQWPEGMYSLLAGFVEPGEPLEAAVRREVLEETGIHTGNVRYLASQPWPFPASLMFGCAAEATSTKITIDPAELDDAVWISREDMVTVMAGLHPRIKPARKGAIAHFLITNWLADRLD